MPEEVCLEVPFTPSNEPGMYTPASPPTSDSLKEAIKHNIAGLISAIIAMVLILVFGKVFVRPFSLTDPDIQYQMRPEIINYGWVLGFGIVLPPVIISIYSVREKVDKLQIISRVLFYWFGFTFNIIYTEFLKLSVGRLRPDFLDRCKPDPVTLDCTGNPKTVEDGRKSFPSGHSSTSFYAAMFIIFWLWTVPKIGKKYIKSPMGMLILLGVFSAASFVAVSRLEQFVHHPTDVLAGALIGLVIAYIIVRVEVKSAY